MVKIKEIKKISSAIKEIKLEKKETLEEEVEELKSEDSPEFALMRRRNATSTLAQNEAPQETAGRQRIIAKEDEVEMNFRPSYAGGGNPYKEKKYTPVGSAESGAVVAGRAIGEQTLRQQDQFIQRQEELSQDERSAGRPDSSSE